MVKDVWPYLTGGILLTAALALMGYSVWAAVAGAATVAVASFFRDPSRRVPIDPSSILSPADGKVVEIARDAAGSSTGARRISIFLSVFNVHVNRAPVAGRVTDIVYTPGSFLPAFREKASELNESNLISMETSRGPLQVRQIAGLIARRIRCWKQPGDAVSQGEKIGFITFGSRVDLFVPASAELKVSVGDSVRGGTSVVAVYTHDGAPS